MKQLAENGVVVDFNPFEGGELQLMAPSTESQREIWTAAKLSVAASLAFNESVTLRFKGALEIPMLRRAVERLGQRHESLRSTFSPDGMLFCVAFALAIDVCFIDLSADSDQDQQLATLLTQAVESPFDLEHGPLFRASIIKMSAQDHVLLLTAHHIICDGWSYAILLKDLAAFYMSEMQGKPAELAAANPFSTYATQMQERESTSEYLADETYWLETFKTIPTSLDLPTDRPRPAFKSFTANREDHGFEKSLVDSIKKTGGKLGCSFVQILLAGFEVLLHRLSGQVDLVVGISAAGQSARGQMNLVGHCVNTLPLRNKIHGDMKFGDFLKSVKKTMLDAYDHQQYTYGTLLRRLKIPCDPSRLPLCSVLFNVDQTLDANKLGFQDLQVEFKSNPRRFENFELFVNAVENAGSVILEIQYNSDLFDAESIRHLFFCYETLMRDIVTEPHREISRYALLSQPLQEKILLTWNNTEKEFPYDATLSELFSRQALLTPENIAVQFEFETGISYRLVEEQSNQLAHYLRSQGVMQGTLVGLYVSRSVEMLIAALAILKAGGAYVPLDPAYPQDRIGFMISDSRLAIIVSHTCLINTLPSHQAQVVLLDREAANIAAQSCEPVEPLSDPEDPAYVIYTSGSTGKPKGVVVPHRGAVNFLTSMSREPGISAQDILVAVTTLSFDIAVLELFLPITVGAKTLIVSRETASDGMALLRLLKQSKATMMQATPATWRLLIAAGWQGALDFKALCGGEVLSRDLVSQLLTRAGSLWNMYGPTETTVWSSCCRIANAESPITIGRPIDNTQLYILDPDMRAVPIGVPGELYIGGAGVTLGYLHRPDLTVQRFVSNPYFDPFAKILCPRLYKTGDRARYLADGSVEYMGRNDHQVKVRGYRIELGEIETIVAQLPEVQQCVVMVREDQPGDCRIVAYVIPSSGSKINFDQLRLHLRGSLPEYMVPQHLMVLDHFPQTDNGKIDRKTLPEPIDISEPFDHEEFELPQTEMECHIARIWSELLRTERVGLHDNFFNLGGHSLLVMQFISRFQKETGYQVNVRMVMLNTLAQIAEQLSHTEPVVPEVTPATIGNGLLSRLRKGFRGKKLRQESILKVSSRPAPASLMQERLWQLDQTTPGQTAYNLPAAFRLKGTLHLSALQRGVNEFVKRHESLRTTLVQNSHGILEQRVANTLEIELNPFQASEQDMLRMIMELATQSFDLTHGPLVRARLYQLSDQEHVLFWMSHHAVWDGWSFDIFIREIAALYEAYTQSKPSPLAKLEFHYGDYALWQKERSTQGQLLTEQTYWQQQLTGPLPELIFPQQKFSRSAASLAGSMHQIAYPKSLVDAVTAVGRQEGVTLSNVLLSAFKILLYSYSSQIDLIVGLPVQGRNEAAFQDLIGTFVNTLLIRTQINRADLTFRQLLKQVQERTLEAFQHQEMPFEQLPVDAAPQAMFSFQDASQRNSHWGNLVLEQFPVHSGGVSSELLLWFKSDNKGLMGAIEYRSDRFDAAMIMGMERDYAAILRAIIENPDLSLREVAVLLKNKSVETIKKVTRTVRAPDPLFSKPMNPFFFDSHGQQMFAVYHPPRANTVSAKAVLLCNPIGEEYLRGHWSFHQLTTQLLRSGFPVMRFDYTATGDSQGESTEGNLTNWQADVKAAAEKLRAISGMDNISVVGLRFGAALAALAGNAGLEMQDLILWDPVLNGQEYLQEIKSLHCTLLARPPFCRVLTAKQTEALAEMIGFAYPAKLQQEIAGIDLRNAWSCKAGKTFVVTTRDEQQFAVLGADVICKHVAEPWHWDKLALGANTLITPLAIQTILSALTGRLS